MRTRIDEEKLQQVAPLADKLKERLEFKEIEAAMEIMRKDELASAGQVDVTTIS
jgi:hypothetical protein